MDSVLRELLSSKIQKEERGILGYLFPIEHKDWDGRLCNYFGGIEESISVDDLLDNELDVYELLEYDDSLMRDLLEDNLSEFIEFVGV